MLGRKTIFVIIPTLSCGGAERVVSTLSRQWAEDHDVYVIVFDAGGAFYLVGGELIALGIPASGTYLKKMANFFGRVRRLSALIKQKSPDLIIGFMEGANFVAFCGGLLNRKLDRVVLSVRDNPKVFPLISQLLIALFYRFARRVVGPSKQICDILQSRFFVPECKVLFIPNPLDFEEIQSKSQEGTSLSVPKRYGLAIGRLTPQKGFDMLLEAYAQVRDKNFDLVILGEGPQRELLHQQITDLGLSAHVHLLGFVPNPFAFLKRAEFFVLSSRHEGWPNVLTEAMACGVCSIAYDCETGPREIITQGKDGLLVAANDVVALSREMARIMSHDDLRLRLGREGQKTVSFFNAPSVAQRWLNLC